MGRIKIKHPSPTREAKGKLLEILGKNNIYAARIIPLRDGYVVITSRDEEVDSIFSPECHENLRTENFTAVMPPDLKAKRTILLFGIDEDAFDHTPEEIRDEIYRINDYTEDCIEAIYKFPTSRVIKITFCNTAPALRAQDIGVKLFNTRVPPHQIQKEEYHELKNCLRCYAIEDHVAAQCPKPREYKICSECSEEDHTWRECNASQKKCINCGGEHRTLAYKCPQRKAALGRAKEKAKDNAKTYSQAATAPPSPQQFPAMPLLTAETQQKIHIAMTFALYQDVSQPGSFEETLNRILRRNNIAEIIIGEPIDSRKVLNLPTAPPPTTTSNTTPPTTPSQPPSPPPLIIHTEPSTPLREENQHEHPLLHTTPPNREQVNEPTPTPHTEETAPLPSPTTPSTNNSTTDNPPSPKKPTNTTNPPKKTNPATSSVTHLTNPNLTKTAAITPHHPKLSLNKEAPRTRNQINKAKHSQT